MKFKVLSLAGIAVATYALPAFAHHSFSMFDGNKTVTLVGAVKDFEWTNPHSWIYMEVRDEKGIPQQWSLEMNPPGALALKGWVPKTLKPGDRITAIIHPLKDGSHGGQFVQATLASGKIMYSDVKLKK